MNGKTVSDDKETTMTTETTQEAKAIAVTRDMLTEALGEFYLTVRSGPVRQKGQIVDPGEVADVLHATLSRIAAERGPGGEDRDELARLRNGARELGRIVVRQSRSMRAAAIAMAQDGPHAGMQWILNSIPPPVDEGDGELWNGTETAAEWLDRVEAADRAAEAAAK